MDGCWHAATRGLSVEKHEPRAVSRDSPLKIETPVHTGVRQCPASRILPSNHDIASRSSMIAVGGASLSRYIHETKKRRFWRNDQAWRPHAACNARWNIAWHGVCDIGRTGERSTRCNNDVGAASSSHACRGNGDEHYKQWHDPRISCAPKG